MNLRPLSLLSLLAIVLANIGYSHKLNAADDIDYAEVFAGKIHLQSDCSFEHIIKYGVVTVSERTNNALSRSMSSSIEEDGSFIIYNRIKYLDYHFKLYDPRINVTHREIFLSKHQTPGPIDIYFTCEKSLLKKLTK